MDCNLAVVFLIDISGSMNESTTADPNGPSVLRRVKQAVVSLIQTIPADRWVCGLATFPNVGVPRWPTSGLMQLLTDANRQSFIQAVNSLSASGLTDVVDGMNLAGYMLESQDELPRFLVIFTDGNLTSTGITEQQIQNAANLMKTRQVFIMTGGYTLSSSEQNFLRSIASDPNAFFNTVTGDEIENYLKENVSDLCSYVPVQISLEPPAFTTATNDPIAVQGQRTGTATVRWVFGEAGDFRLRSNRPWVQIERVSQAFALGPGTQPQVRKFAVAPDAPGQHSVGFFAERVGGTGSAAFAYLPVEAVTDSFELFWEGGNPRGSQIWFQPKRIDGRVRIKTVVQRATVVRVNVTVRGPNAGSWESGWTLEYPISVEAAPGSTEITKPFRLVGRDLPSGVRIVEASAAVLGLTRRIQAEVAF